MTEQPEQPEQPKLEDPLANIERELITTVTLTDGRRVEVRMPVMQDLFWIMCKTPNDNIYPYLVQAALKGSMEFTEFLKLNVVDGQRIMEPIGKAYVALQNYDQPKKSKSEN